MPITIRQAEFNDAKDIAQVQIETWRSTYSGIVPDAFLSSMDIKVRTQSWKEQLVNDKTLIYVASDDSGISGFASGGKLRGVVGDYDAELYAIYLLCRTQGRGVGRSVTQTLARGLHAQGMKSLLVWVLEQNPAVGFYKHLGAVQVASQSIQIGGADLPEIALGWPDLERLLPSRQHQAVHPPSIT